MKIKTTFFYLIIIITIMFILFNLIFINKLDKKSEKNKKLGDENIWSSHKCVQDDHTPISETYYKTCHIKNILHINGTFYYIHNNKNFNDNQLLADGLSVVDWVKYKPTPLYFENESIFYSFYKDVKRLETVLTYYTRTTPLNIGHIIHDDHLPTFHTLLKHDLLKVANKTGKKNNFIFKGKKK
jgi:hypothetical protein